MISDANGDLWRIWPNVGAWPIKGNAASGSWDRLCDWRAVLDMQPSMALAAVIPGETWTRIRFRLCAECEGSGEFLGAVIVTDADGRGHVEHGHPDCSWCRGEGWLPEFAEVVRPAEVLGRIAA